MPAAASPRVTGSPAWKDSPQKDSITRRWAPSAWVRCSGWSGGGWAASEGDIWLYALYEQRGDTAALERLLAKPWVRFRDQNPVYAAIRDWQPWPAKPAPAVALVD